jgi:hypothetical protein
MAKYEEFLRAHKSPKELGKKPFLQDVRMMQGIQAGRAMNEDVQIALGEFYLCVASQLRPDELNAAGSDNAALLQVARRCAEEDFEPFIEHARNFVADYDSGLHKALEETCPLYEVEDGLFWRANFDVASAAEFQHFLTALGHGSGQRWVPDKTYTSPKDVEGVIASARDALNGDDVVFEPARRAAKLTYEKWLEASSMPVKADIIKALSEHGLLVTEKDVHHSSVRLPVVASMYPSEQQNSSV